MYIQTTKWVASVKSSVVRLATSKRRTEATGLLTLNNSSYVYGALPNRDREIIVKKQYLMFDRHKVIDIKPLMR